MARHSVTAAKAATARARTYPDARDAMLVQRCGCGSHRPPPQEVLDAIAEREMTGGWDTSRENMCPRCFVACSASGICPLCGERK